MRTVAVKLASRFYADDAVLEVLMSMPGIYNAYVDGDMAVLEVDEAVVKPGEAVRNALLKAEELGLSSIAFPAISTGCLGVRLTRLLERCRRFLGIWRRG